MLISSQSFFLFSLSLVFNTLASPTLQRDALLEFKNEFPISAPDPDDFFALSFSSWNTSSDHCSWEGVTCNAKSGEVISLSLHSIFLNGSLKANTSLLKLQHLNQLTLSNCDLIGEIPSSLGNLSHLTTLNLDYNHLTGEVPPSIGNLNQLIDMRLVSNNLSGNIPSSFANFKKLSQLSLSDNQFSGGDLPYILSNLTSLSNFDISNNHIKSTLPSNMSGLHNLKAFQASGNSLVWNVPTSLFMIPSLVLLNLDDNKFEGPLEFGNTSSSSELFFLYLASNNFYGPISEYISQFLKLEIIDLSHNSFTGSIPRSMSQLVSPRHLDLSYNKLEGQIPSFLWSVSSVKLSHNYFSSLEKSLQVVNSSNSSQGQVNHVDLGSNSLEGSFPREICKFTSLDFLDLSNNHLTGSLPSCLMNSTASARDINLRNNNLSGLLPDILPSAIYLRSIDVSHNQLIGKVPESLINCKSMEYLNLKGNKLKDTFPSWLTSLVWLRVLFLGSNALYGPIPSHVGFPSLRVLDISHNGFHGTLPQDYFVKWHEMSTVWAGNTGMPQHSVFEDGPYSGYKGEIYSNKDSMEMMYKGVDTEFSRIFHGFKAIDFSGNKFTGQIPKSIGLLKELILVNFSRNAFTGSIPSSLANITNLEALDLSHNKLSGNIPRDLARLSFVSYLDFSHNLLQGPVPRSTQFQRQHCSSFEDNLGLYGLEEICGKIHDPEPTSGDPQQSEEFSSEESEEVLNWIAAAIAFGPGVFCGLVIGYIFFASQKHKWFMEKFGGNYHGGIITVR